MGIRRDLPQGTGCSQVAGPGRSVSPCRPPSAPLSLATWPSAGQARGSLRGYQAWRDSPRAAERGGGTD